MDPHPLLVRRDDETISLGRRGVSQWAVLVFIASPAFLGLWGLSLSDDLARWAVVVAALLVGLGSLGVGCWAVATASEAELRGLMTEVGHVEIRKGAVARHYRDAPDRPTLKAAGRTWPLSALRRVDLGEQGDKRTLYLVLDDEVLRLEAPNVEPELAEAGRGVAEAAGVPFERRADRDWQSATWGPALLVSAPLVTTIGGPWLAWDLAASTAPLRAVAAGLATMLFPVLWRFVIVKTTRRILLPAGRTYVRERFGIEPRA